MARKSTNVSEEVVKEQPEKPKRHKRLNTEQVVEEIIKEN